VSYLNLKNLITLANNTRSSLTGKRSGSRHAQKEASGAFAAVLAEQYRSAGSPIPLADFGRMNTSSTKQQVRSNAISNNIPADSAAKKIAVKAPFGTISTHNGRVHDKTVVPHFSYHAVSQDLTPVQIKRAGQSKAASTTLPSPITGQNVTAGLSVSKATQLVTANLQKRVSGTTATPLQLGNIPSTPANSPTHSGEKPLEKPGYTPAATSKLASVAQNVPPTPAVGKHRVRASVIPNNTHGGMVSESKPGKRVHSAPLEEAVVSKASEGQSTVTANLRKSVSGAPAAPLQSGNIPATAVKPVSVTQNVPPTPAVEKHRVRSSFIPNNTHEGMVSESKQGRSVPSAPLKEAVVYEASEGKSTVTANLQKRVSTPTATPLQPGNIPSTLSGSPVHNGEKSPGKPGYTPAATSKPASVAQNVPPTPAVGKHRVRASAIPTHDSHQRSEAVSTSAPVVGVTSSPKIHTKQAEFNTTANESRQGNPVQSNQAVGLNLKNKAINPTGNRPSVQPSKFDLPPTAEIKSIHVDTIAAGKTDSAKSSPFTATLNKNIGHSELANPGFSNALQDKSSSTIRQGKAIVEAKPSEDNALKLQMNQENHKAGESERQQSRTANSQPERAAVTASPKVADPPTQYSAKAVNGQQRSARQAEMAESRKAEKVVPNRPKKELGKTSSSTSELKPQIGMNQRAEAVKSQVLNQSADREEDIGKILNIRDLSEKIRAKAKLIKSDVKTVIEVKLNPANLGKVRLLIETHEDQMRLLFSAERPEAVAALENARGELGSLLAEQGYNLSSCDVDNQFPQNRWQEARAASDGKQHHVSRDTEGEGGAPHHEEEPKERHRSLNFGYNTLDLVA